MNAEQLKESDMTIEEYAAYLLEIGELTQEEYEAYLESVGDGVDPEL